MRPLAILLLLVLAAPAHAQVQMQLTMPCWPHPVVIKMIGDKFKEVPDSFGVSGRSFVELFVSPTGSWTLMTTAPLGLTCIMASGDSWEKLPSAKYGDPT